MGINTTLSAPYCTNFTLGHFNADRRNGKGLKIYQRKLLRGG